jgi:hypothetical protein
MKQALEIHSEGCAAAAAILWFISARVRLKKRSIMRGGLGSGLDDRKTLLLLVYEQSRWSARAAIAAGFAALLAMLDGLLPKIQRATSKLEKDLQSDIAPWDNGAVRVSRIQFDCECVRPPQRIALS